MQLFGLQILSQIVSNIFSEPVKVESIIVTKTGHEDGNHVSKHVVLDIKFYVVEIALCWRNIINIIYSGGIAAIK
jgi:hypothetical protein